MALRPGSTDNAEVSYETSIMKSRLARMLLLVGMLPSLPAAGAGETLRIEAAGIERSVLVYAPEQAKRNLTDLVIVFHGRGDDAAAFARAVQLHKDWPEAIVAYPRGELHPGKTQRGWQYRRGQYDDRDLLLTDGLLGELSARFRISPTRTYAAGFSNGGHFVFLLMQERPALFAAHAVLGAVHPEFAADAPPRPLLYLFGRGEDSEYQDDWQRTVESLIRHQRTTGPLEEALGCCKLQRAGDGGAPFVFGIYNAGHIWPSDGNAWLRAFFSDSSMSPVSSDSTKSNP